MKKRISWIFLLGVLLIPGTHAEETAFELYELGFAEPRFVAEALQTMLGGKGTVTPDVKGRRLLVMATKEQHRRIKELIVQLDIVPQNVRIDVRFDGMERARDQGFGVSGSRRVILDGDKTRSSITLSPEIHSRITDRRQNVTQTRMV